MERTRYRRYGLEAVTIVASILFALWLDAAWEEHQDREREAHYLEGLAVEFSEASRELASDQRVRKAILNNLRAALGPPDSPDLAEARIMASSPSNLLNSRFYTPSHAHLDDLLASGSLQLLESDTLRLALLGYLQERDRLAVVEQRYRAFIGDNVEPYVLAHGDLAQHSVGLGPDQTRPMDIAVWDDKRFVNLVWLEAAKLNDVIFFAERLEQRISEVLEALEAHS